MLIKVARIVKYYDLQRANKLLRIDYSSTLLLTPIAKQKIDRHS